MDQNPGPRSKAGQSQNALENAREIIRHDLAQFEDALREALELQQDYLTETERALYRQGEKLRPLLLLLAARATCLDAEVALPNKAICASVSLEMLHVATLIHDDILDAAPLSGARLSVQAERGTELAVLIGDLQLIQAIRCFASAIDSPEDMRLVRLVLDGGFKVCCGELDVLATDPSWGASRLLERYFRSIERKTGSLFAVACECGASLVDAPRREVLQISRFGRQFGLALQIMSDVFDLKQPEAIAAKTLGGDLARRRITLPVIYALEQSGDDHLVRQVLEGGSLDDDGMHAAISAVRSSDGPMRAWSNARERMAEGVEHLGALRPTPSRDALIALSLRVVDYDLVSDNKTFLGSKDGRW